MWRWAALTILVGCLFISGWFRWRARRTSGIVPRRRQGGLVLAAPALTGWLALSAILAHLVNPRDMCWATFDPAPWTPWTGLGLGLLGPPTLTWTLVAPGASVSETALTKASHALVTSGPYRWVRHPRSAIGIARRASIGLMLSNSTVLAFAAMAWGAFRLVVHSA